MDEPHATYHVRGYYVLDAHGALASLHVGNAPSDGPWRTMTLHVARARRAILTIEGVLEHDGTARWISAGVRRPRAVIRGVSARRALAIDGQVADALLALHFQGLRALENDATYALASFP